MPLFIKGWLVMLAVTVISGCTTMQPASSKQEVPALYSSHLASLRIIHEFQIKSRIGVQTDARGFSGSALWTHSPDSDDIALFSPLGSQVASILADSNGVSLTNQDGAVYRESSAEILTQKTLGWSLPMTGLSDWVLGRPTTSEINLITWDEFGRINRLHQDGWEIEFSQYSTIDGVSLPGKVFLRSPKLNLKLIIESWSLSPSNHAYN